MGIYSFFVQELTVRTLLCDAAVLDDQYSIAVDDGGESMSHDDHGSVVLAEQDINSLLDLVFALCV